MAEKIKLQVVTPERKFFEDDVDGIFFKSTEGDIGVLNDHIPLTTGIVSGMLVIKNNDKEEKAVIHGGFAEITPEYVTILTDAAEWPHEINKNRAEEAKERADRRIQASEPQVNILRAKAALVRALTRLEVAEYHSDIEE